MLDSDAVTRVVLSPHLDDAALSIGGLIARFTAAGEAILVVTVAAGSPPPHTSLSPFVASLHRAWGLSSTEAVARRRREDEAAMAILGAEALHLDQLDAVYRLPDRYGTEAALISEPAGEDRFLRRSPLRDEACAVALRGAEMGCELAPTTFDIATTIDRKIAAIFAYSSQIGSLFGGREQARSAITAHARSVGRGAPAERIWRLR